MDFNKLTIKTQEAVAAARGAGSAPWEPQVHPEHLCLRCSTRSSSPWAGPAHEEPRLSARPSLV